MNVLFVFNYWVCVSIGCSLVSTTSRHIVFPRSTSSFGHFAIICSCLIRDDLFSLLFSSLVYAHIVIIFILFFLVCTSTMVIIKHRWIVLACGVTWPRVRRNKKIYAPFLRLIEQMTPPKNKKSKQQRWFVFWRSHKENQSNFYFACFNAL